MELFTVTDSLGRVEIGRFRGGHHRGGGRGGRGWRGGRGQGFSYGPAFYGPDFYDYEDEGAYAAPWRRGPRLIYADELPPGVQAVSGSTSSSSTIKTIQQDLRRIGSEVKPTGIVDKATVTAVNDIFRGWDDAPARLREGDLTAGQISKNAKIVAKYIRKAVGDATTFADVNPD